MALDPVVAQSEPDWEVQELLARSGGPNLGMDFLPGAIGFDPVAHTVDPDEAARVLWFDALVENVDRSWRNPNLLRWPTSFPRHSARPSELWCIDHGACLYFHHSWARAAAVVKWLVTHGVAAKRVTARGFGALVPLERNDTEEGRRKNRRVEFRVLRRSPQTKVPRRK